MPHTNRPLFHSDHLGSTSYLTDHDGNVSQFVCYTPYGETLVDEHLTGVDSILHNGTYRTRYLFNGKELDTETNLYYYGARYFEPREILWYGVDPLTEKYPFNSSYVYCNANPVKYVDPDGKEYIIYFNVQRKKYETKAEKEQRKSNERLTIKLGALPDHDDMLFICAHGSPSGFEIADKTKIEDAESFDFFITNYNGGENVFAQNLLKDKQTPIILYSCSTGKGDNSIGQQLSAEFETLVFAPSEKVCVTSTDDIQIYSPGVIFNTGGVWNVFYKGMLVDQIDAYSEWRGLFGDAAVQLKDFLQGKSAAELLEKYERIYQEKMQQQSN